MTDVLLAFIRRFRDGRQDGMHLYEAWLYARYPETFDKYGDWRDRGFGGA